MAMSGGKDDGEPMMEMNTTPLIDVMLVLLIMFIITIPVQTHSVKIDLPVDDGSPPPDVPIDPVRNKLAINDFGTITWNGTVIPASEDLLPILVETKSFDPVPELQFQPAARTPYDIVNEVIGVINRAQVTKLGFVGNDQYATFGKQEAAN